MKRDIREYPTYQERVSVRMNLNTGSIIVKRRNSENGKYGETLMETPDCVILSHVEFRVQDAAYEKVVEEESRDVCAYAVGLFETVSSDEDLIGKVVDEDYGTEIRYNPFRHKYFHMQNTSSSKPIPVESAYKLFTWSEETEDGPKGRMKALRPLVHKTAL